MVERGERVDGVEGLGSGSEGDFVLRGVLFVSFPLSVILLGGGGRRSNIPMAVIFTPSPTSSIRRRKRDTFLVNNDRTCDRFARMGANTVCS